MEETRDYKIGNVLAWLQLELEERPQEASGLEDVPACLLESQWEPWWLPRHGCECRSGWPSSPTSSASRLTSKYKKEYEDKITLACCWGQHWSGFGGQKQGPGCLWWTCGTEEWAVSCSLGTDSGDKLYYCFPARGKREISPTLTEWSPCLY